MMGDYSSIHKRQAVCWFVFRLIGFVVVLAAIIGLYCAAKYAFAENTDFPKELENIVMTFNYVISSFLLLILSVFTFIMPFLQQAKWKYRINGDCIEVCHGVIIKTVQIVPQARVQHLSVIRLISDRAFGLARISVTTANGTIVIMGLLPQQAEELARSINDRVNVLVLQEKVFEEAR